MRMAKTSAKIFTVLATLLWLVPGGWAQGQPAAKTTKKTKAAAASTQTTAPAVPPADPEKSVVVNKRDPFHVLIDDSKGRVDLHLPPGKAGLVIESVRIDGTVQSGVGMIAMVSNPDQRVYFIREGDRLYDGDVEKIGLDGVTFRENSKDAFGKPVERVVTKRIYASAGEQQ